MQIFRDVLNAYAESGSRWRVFLSVHVFLRLLAVALTAPLVGGLINLAVSFSHQAALTDQDIALFLLSPAGFVLGLVVLSIALVAEVTGFAAMAATLRYEHDGPWASLRTAVMAVLRRLYPLTLFFGHFLLRLLLLAAPFVLAAGGVALWLLTDYDINYYLTFRPPAFVWAAGLIGALVVALALVLLVRLSSWALALHLVLFEDEAPADSFAESARRMQGHHLRLQGELLIWFALRSLAALLLAAMAGLVVGWLPVGTEDQIMRVLIAALLVMLAWVVSGAVLAALALGALAVLLDRHLGSLKPDLPADIGDGPEAGMGVVGLGLGGVLVAGVSVWLGAQMMEAVQARDDVQIIAHRGAAGSRPENTQAAIEEALIQQADWVEVDVQETLDGRVVVLHDADLMKLAGVNMRVHAADYADLRRLDIGSWFDPAYADQHVPLLSEVLDQVRGRARLLIEFKHYGHAQQLEQRVIDLVGAADMDRDIAFMSLKYDSVLTAKQLRPDLRGGILAASAVGDVAGLQGDFVAVRGAVATPALIREVQAAGKEIYVWTINDPLEMSKFISKGVDGLITDEPGLARRVLAVRAELNTAERLVLWLAEELGLDLTPRGYRDDQP